MIFDGFKISATPYIYDAYCRECERELKEVSNGFLGRAMYCPHCENVYSLKLVKVPKSKITEKYLEQCRKETSKK